MKIDWTELLGLALILAVGSFLVLKLFGRRKPAGPAGFAMLPANPLP